MKITLKVPKSAVSSQEGKLLEWYVADGAKVSAGDPIYSIETEKAALDVEAPFAGTVTHIGNEGETYPVGSPIAELVKG